MCLPNVTAGLGTYVFTGTVYCAVPVLKNKKQ